MPPYPFAPSWVNPAAAAYMAQADAEADQEALKLAIHKARNDLPDTVTMTPQFQTARGMKITGLVLMPAGGTAVFGGLLWFIFASLQGLGGTADGPGQMGGLAVMTAGAVTLTAGGIVFGLGKSRMTTIENEYLRQRFPGVEVGVGPGSLLVSGSF